MSITSLTIQIKHPFVLSGFTFLFKAIFQCVLYHIHNFLLSSGVIFLMQTIRSYSSTVTGMVLGFRYILYSRTLVGITVLYSLYSVVLHVHSFAHTQSCIIFNPTSCLFYFLFLPSLLSIFLLLSFTCNQGNKALLFLPANYLFLRNQSGQCVASHDMLD